MNPRPGGIRTGTLAIITPGMLTTVQDLGRPGHGHLGVPPSGAADSAALRLANRLVGNVEHAAGLECTMGGLSFVVDVDRYISVTGAPVTVSVDDCPITEPGRFFVNAGSRITLGQPLYGLRTYVAVAGGIDAPRTFGSASTDTLSGLGGTAVPAEAELPLAVPAGPVPDVPLELALTVVPARAERIRFRWGPRVEGISDHARNAFTRSQWQVSSATNRVGARLIGPRLFPDACDQPSEGMVTGTIQIPESGQPIIFLADHPTTGGYPVIGVVAEDDLGLVAQSRPGTQLLFTAI